MSAQVSRSRAARRPAADEVSPVDHRWRSGDTESTVEFMAAPEMREGGNEGVRLSVGAVARLLGVAAPTLRTWDRRYGLAPSERSHGRHRRYTPVDVARLAHMRQLTLRGVVPAEAAAAALATPADRFAGAAPERAALEPAALGPAALGPVALEPAAPEPTPAAERSDRVDRPPAFQLGRVSAQARGLARSVLEMDGPTITEIVADSVERQGVVTTWDDTVAPVLVAVGRRWQRSGGGIEMEHLLSEAVLGVLATRTAAMAGRSSNTRPLLLAATADEMHVLAMHALAAALAERRIDARLLGARVPGPALSAAVRRLTPSAVFLWSHGPATAKVDTGRLLTAEPPPALVLGGPGWDPAALPPGALLATNLARAVDLLATLAA